jgi:hypothetical protein
MGSEDEGMDFGTILLALANHSLLALREYPSFRTIIIN